MKHKITFATAAILTLFLFITLILPESRVAVSYNNGPYKFILDAGHGGADGGAVGPDGTYESTLNLNICQKLDAVLGLFGYSTVLTRNSEEIDYPDSADTIHKKKVYDQNSRIELINSVENGILISIHLNKYPSAQPHGAQALYSKATCSRELAECMQSLFIETLQDGNRRAAAQIPSDVYLMKKVSCPAVLVECGFMSNPDEFALLKTDSYRTKLAVLIAASCVKCSRTHEYKPS
jgi:N-acetylmuramoyl-L-alanine amidase